MGEVGFQINTLISATIPSTVERKKKCKVFVSYSRHDEALVRPLAGLLGVAANDAVFLDVTSLKPGELWEDEIFTALREASVFVLCWCCESQKSKNVAKEIAAALSDQSKKLVPVLFCEMPLPVELSKRQWTDLRGKVVHDCAHHADMITLGQKEAKAVVAGDDAAIPEKTLLDEIVCGERDAQAKALIQKGEHSKAVRDLAREKKLESRVPSVAMKPINPQNPYNPFNSANTHYKGDQKRQGQQSSHFDDVTSSSRFGWAVAGAVVAGLVAAGALVFHYFGGKILIRVLGWTGVGLVTLAVGLILWVLYERKEAA